MEKVQRAPEVRGKTMRWTWTEGPTKGTTHEHVFHENGKVEWRQMDAAHPKRASAQEREPAAEQAEYGAFKVADGVYAVSYLAASGYTLTVVLNFDNHRMVGFASGAKDWHPIQGTFTVQE